MTPTQVSPTIVFVILILAALVFLCGSFHWLYRVMHNNRGASTEAEMTRSNPPFQRQIHQLFRLHDSGLDQAVIDTLPVFLFRDITKRGSNWKEQFDCAVCLCEFSEKDQLRLLPQYTHAFHLECIDTWLLSNSTCPLCRGSLHRSPGFEFGDHGKEEDGDGRIVVSSKRVFSVRLGRLRGIPEGDGCAEETSSSSSIDTRRCYSMGSYGYIVSNTELQVESYGNEGMRIRVESFSVSKIWQWSSKKRTCKQIIRNTNTETVVLIQTRHDTLFILITVLLV